MTLLRRIAPKLAKTDPVKKTIEKWSKPKKYRIGNLESDPDLAILHPHAWGSENTKEYNALSHRVLRNQPEPKKHVDHSMASSHSEPGKSSTLASKVHPGSLAHSGASSETPEAEIKKRLSKARGELKTIGKPGLAHSMEKL